MGVTIATRLPENIPKTAEKGARDGTRRGVPRQVRICSGSRPRSPWAGATGTLGALNLHDGSLEDEATPRCISDRQRPDRDGPRTNPGNHRVWGQHQREPDGEPRFRVRDAAAGVRKLARAG